MNVPTYCGCFNYAQKLEYWRENKTANICKEVKSLDATELSSAPLPMCMRSQLLGEYAEVIALHN